MKQVKNLGVHFSFSPRETVDLNYQKLITKVMGLCEKYDRFHYDLFKKVYVLNTYILSQVWYISRIIYPPKWFIDQVKNVLEYSYGELYSGP